MHKEHTDSSAANPARRANAPRYILCSRLFPGTAWVPVVKKVAVIGALAPVQISCTFSLATVMAGGTAADCLAKIRRDGVYTWAAFFGFWPPVLALNMRYVALHAQAQVGGVGHAFWNVFLAYMANANSAQTSARGSCGTD